MCMHGVCPPMHVALYDVQLRMSMSTSMHQDNACIGDHP